MHFFGSLSDLLVSLLCGKLIYFSIFHISLTPEWDRVFQQDGTSMTNRRVIASLPLLVCIPEVALPPFWLNLLLAAHAQVPHLLLCLLCCSIFFCLFFIPRHAIFRQAISEEIFHVWLTENSRALCACPVHLICSTSASVADSHYHHLCVTTVLHKTNINLLQEWTVGILWD